MILASPLPDELTACFPHGHLQQPIAKLVRNSIRQEGIKVLFKGWVPAVLRMTPNTVLTFMFYEQIKKTLMSPGTQGM